VCDIVYLLKYGFAVHCLDIYRFTTAIWIINILTNDQEFLEAVTYKGLTQFLSIYFLILLNYIDNTCQKQSTIATYLLIMKT